MKAKNNLKSLLTLTLFLAAIIVLPSFVSDKIPGDWLAPKSADILINPLKGNAEATKAGKKLYTTYCTVCHGNTGKGDGPAGLALNPTPADHSSKKVQSQTDGAIYWKIKEGRSPMASYRQILTVEQRWQLVNYIRELNKQK